jgi:hypothetical protein
MGGAGGDEPVDGRVDVWAGLGLTELLHQRVKDVDVERGQVVRGGKGDEDRVTVLPYALPLGHASGLMEGLGRTRP